MNLNSHLKTKIQNTSDCVGQEAGTDKQGSTKATSRTPKTGQTRPTKTQTVISLLRRRNGATIDELAAATGWQHHSIRGLISGTIKKRFLFNVVTKKGGKSGTRYRIQTARGARS